MALVPSSLPPIVRLEVSLLVPLDGDDLRVNALQYFCEKKLLMVLFLFLDCLSLNVVMHVALFKVRLSEKMSRFMAVQF